MPFKKIKKVVPGKKKNSSPVSASENMSNSNSEVTVTIPQEDPPIINTAMATHIGTREYQQDAAYVCDPLKENGLAFGILCDGMGGTTDGERASSETVVFMANRIMTLQADDDIQEFLENAAYDVNYHILVQNEKLQQNSGTTLLTVIIDKSRLYWLSIGDSRIYIIRSGEMVQTTTDHNYALELKEKVDKGLLTQAEADNDPRKEHLISYIGVPLLERMDINYIPFQLQANDIILLCSDGLIKALFTENILDIITRCGDNIAEAARLLPLEALKQSPYALDNTTVILIQYLGENTGSPDAEQSCIK